MGGTSPVAQASDYDGYYYERLLQMHGNMTVNIVDVVVTPRRLPGWPSSAQARRARAVLGLNSCIE